MCPIGLIRYVKSYTHVTLYLRILKDFLHLKCQEFLMFSASASFGDGIFPKGHLMFSCSININFNPDRLGVLCFTEKSMLKQLHKLTNCGKYRGLSNWLWMQGNCLVFGNSEKNLRLALDAFLWQSCPLSPVVVAATSETENVCFWVRQHNVQHTTSKPAETLSQLTIAFLVLIGTQHPHLEST